MLESIAGLADNNEMTGTPMSRDFAFDDALRLEQEGNYAKAFELLQKCLFKDESNENILFHCGWCLENDNTGDKKLAVSFYKRAAAAAESPHFSVKSFFRAGWLLLQEKEYHQASLFFKQAMDAAEHHNLKNDNYKHAVYWYAVCMETQGCYIEALKRYRLVQEKAPLLDPESRFRQIICLIHIGSYEEALKLCVTFKNPPPSGFDEDRYRQISRLVKQEQELLERCLA